MSKRMIELTATNTEQYLRTHGWLGAGSVAIEPLSGGVSNLVLRVTSADGRCVVRQSRPQLRPRDPWFSDLDRIYREQQVMESLGDVLPPLTVPKVLFADRENFVFAMSHAPPATVWKESLLAGQIEPSMGELTGRVLGKMHETSARNRARFEAFTERTAFVQLRVDPFYRR